MWVSRRYVGMLEREVEYYRAFAERERARADRLHDQLLQDRGCLPATETALVEQEKAQQRMDEQLEQQRRQMTEMYAEAINEHADTLNGADPGEAEMIEGLGEEVAAMLGHAAGRDKAAE